MYYMTSLSMGQMRVKSGGFFKSTIFYFIADVEFPFPIIVLSIQPT